MRHVPISTPALFPKTEGIMMTLGMYVIAHRGSSGYIRENTVAAVRRALELGAAAIEVDVQRTKDGALIVYHDHLVRSAGRWIFIQDAEGAQLRSVDLGDGLTMPLLEEILDVVAGRCPLIIDLKSSYTASSVVDQIRARGAVRWCEIASSLHEEVGLARQLVPELTGSLTFACLPYDVIGYVRRARFQTINLFHGHLDQALVRRVKGAGVTLRAYTVNSPEEARRLASWGVDAIFSDYPDLLKSEK